MKLSFVICVYNTDKEYLKSCLDSLVNSTLPKEKYEICIVDDGSETDYTELLSAYEHKYVKTENRGILAARQLGVELTEGDYVSFVDSDDTVSINYHYPMLELACSENCDIVMNDWAFHTERTRYVCRRDTTVSTDISLLGDEVLLAYTAQEGREHSYFVLWNKIYSRKLLLDSITTVSELTHKFGRFSYSEDALINFFAMKNARSLKNLHTGYYFYRIHDNQTVKVVSKERLREHIECMTFTLDTMTASIGENRYAEKIAAHLDEWRALMSRTHYTYSKSAGYTELYGFIRQAYGVDKLGTSTLRDGAVYTKAGLLGSNFTDIDNELLSVMRSDSLIKVDPRRLSPYAAKTLRFIQEHGGRVEFVSGASLRISKPRVKFKHKLVHNSLLYFLGALLFPKGSRIRAALKRLI